MPRPPADLHRSLKELRAENESLRERLAEASRPVPMILFCPACHARHVDKGTFAERPHHTHACQPCGFCWRPAVKTTVGVDFLPGFKDPE